MAHAQIVPRAQAKGTDFCGQESYQYVIRSDLGCYKEAYHVRDGNGDRPVAIHVLHPTCAWGDHYLATPEYFYIIKGKTCRRVTNLSTGADPITFTLDKNCQGGDFYMATNSSNFYIIRPGGGLRHVKDMTKPDYETLELHDNCKGGLYYWATGGFFYFLKPVGDWALEYHRTRDLTTDRKGVDFPVYTPITSFLPGGLAVIAGPTFGRWKPFGTPVRNNSKSEPLVFNESISRKTGYKKDIIHSVQHNWQIGAQWQKEGSAGLTIEKVFTASLKEMFSFSTTYGGHVVDTTQEDWSEEKEVSKKFVVTIPPGGCVYFWQYTLGIGNEDILHTEYVIMTDNETPPTNVPLPSSEAEQF